MNVEAIREDFPVLREGYIYFDNACMTLRPVQVVRAMDEYYLEYPACGGRSVHKLGTRVSMAVDRARETTAEFLGVEASEVVFTKNTTEAINMVSRSLGLKRGDVVLTTDKEHNSNLVPWHYLRETSGVVHRVVPSREDNTFDTERFKGMMSRDVKLVSMVHISNLDGTKIPEREIIEIAHDHGALVMLDGAQSAPHGRMDLRKMDVDFFALSVHKCMGPTGMGVLYAKEELLKGLSPFIVGGDTVALTTYDKSEFLGPPNRFEGGLQNYAGIIGTDAAFRYLMRFDRDEITEHEVSLNRIITDAFSGDDRLTIIGPQEPEKRNGIFNFVLRGVNPHDVALYMDDQANIMMRSGNHCVHSWYQSRGMEEGSARASMYIYNTEDEARIFVETLQTLMDALIH